MPFIDASMTEVAEMRFSIASSHSAWRDIMEFMAIMDPRSDTWGRFRNLFMIKVETVGNGGLTQRHDNRHDAGDAQLLLEQEDGDTDLDKASPDLVH